MTTPSRQIFFGIALGAVCATTLAAIGPGIAADIIPDRTPNAIDTANLVRFEGRNYDMQYEDWVSTEALSRSTVKKIVMGRVSYVDITRTPTGTYSSDALFSNHIQYPGITVEEVRPLPNHLAYWGTHGWMSFVGSGANSIFTVVADNLVLRTNGHQTCVATRSFLSC